MAKTLSSASIATSNTILAWHVTQSIDALTGTEDYDITISGSLTTTGSVDIQGLLTATAGITHQLTASNAVTASFALNVPSSALPSGILSSSAQIASDISGAFGAPSASFSTRITTNETNIATLTSKTGSYATTGSNIFVGDQTITGSLIASGSSVILNDLTYPTADGIDGAVMVTDGVGNLTMGHGERVVCQIRNTETFTITAGTPVHVVGSVGGSQRVEVVTASADITFVDTMPAIGIASTDLTSAGDGRDGYAVITGVYSDNNFSLAPGSVTVEVGQVLYVAQNGGLTNVKPDTSDSNRIQNIGIVLKTNGTLVQAIQVSSINRTNDVPNLNQSHIFFGSGSNYSQLHISGALDITQINNISASGALLGAKLSIGDYGVSGGSTTDELLISGSGLQRMSIESTNAPAGLRLKSPSTFNTFIDFEEGSDQRFIMGVLSTDDSFYMATGSALVSGSVFKANRATGDIEIINNISASAVSASTYYGDGSNLTGITTDPFPYNGDVLITGSLTTSGSVVDFTNATAISGSTFSGSFSGDGSGLTGIGVDSINGLTDGTTEGGDGNVGLGAHALEDIASGGVFNTALGVSASAAITDRDYTTCIGASAGLNNRSSYNTLIGYNAGRDLGNLGGVAHTANTVVGAEAGMLNSEWQNNVYVGYRAGYRIEQGNNVAIGAYAMNGGTDNAGSQGNVALGFESLYSVTTGDRNTIVGYEAGYDITTGTNNINIGQGVTSLAASTGDIKIGSGSIIPFSGSSVTGDVLFPNTASALYFTGSFAGDGSNLTNLSIFPFTGDAVITGSLLISGSQAFRVDSDDVVIGVGAGNSLDGVATSYNVLLGYRAGYDITSGDQNVMIGQSAGENTNADADENVLIGYQAGYNVISKNTIIGTQAGTNVGSYWNTIIGYQAAYNGSSNTAGNVIIGYQAGIDITGQYNTVIGYTAGQDIDTGDYNINIGWDVSSTSGTDNELLIGKGSTIAISASLSTGDVLFPGDITALKASTATHLLGTTSGATSLTLRSGNTSNVFLDFEEGTNNRYVIGVHGASDELRICNNTASPNSNTAISVALSSGDTTIHNNLLHSGSVTHATSTVASYDNTDSPVTLDGTQRLVKLDSSGGVIAVNLPDSATYPGMQIFFKVTTGGSTITLTAAGSDNIDGAGTDTTLDATNESLSIISDGAGNWYIF